MAVTAQRLATFEELYEAVLALPEGITGEILSDGAIETMGRPGKPHRGTASRLQRTIEDLGRRSGWVIEVEAEVRLLGHRLVVPDLSAWRVFEEAQDFLYENPIVAVPDWTCEILSASTERKDRGTRLPLYARANVSSVWIVDPDARFIEVYETRKGLPVQVCVAREDERARLPPFDLDLDLATLWVPRRKRGTV